MSGGDSVYSSLGVEGRLFRLRGSRSAAAMRLALPIRDGDGRRRVEDVELLPEQVAHSIGHMVEAGLLVRLARALFVGHVREGGNQRLRAGMDAHAPTFASAEHRLRV